MSTAVNAGEVMSVDPITGGMKGEKLAVLGDADPLALGELAKVYGFGRRKYDQYNYAKGYRWSLSYNAMLRHMMAFWNGEDNDPESGLHHMAHACWHGLCLLCFSLRGRGTDDRFPQDAQPQQPLLPFNRPEAI